MLEMLRRGASSKVSMFFIGILLISFVAWPATDGFRSYGAGTAASVGSQTISPEDYQRALSRAIRRESIRSGRVFGLSEARASGLTGRVLDEMLTQGMLDEEVSRYKVGQDIEVMALATRRDPRFQVAGLFDRFAFERYLQSEGFSESEFMNERIKGDLRSQVIEGLSGAFSVPEVFRQAMHEVLRERRKVDFVTITAADLDPVAPPDTAALESYFERHKERLRKPQYRKVEILLMTPEEVGKGIEIAESDLRKEYDARISSYRTPQKRRVKQIIFDTRENADRAAKALSDGTPFDEIAAATDSGGTLGDLGLVEKTDIADEAIADAVFALAENTNSAVIEGKFGPLIARVGEIEPERTTPFEEARGTIEESLRATRAAELILSRQGGIDDAFAESKPFADIAAQFSMRHVALAAVDRNGKDEEGTQVVDFLEEPRVFDDVMGSIFASEVDVENDPVSLPDGGFLWYRVDDTIESRLPEFAEVRDEVARQLQAQKTDEALREKAQALLQKLRAGTTLDAIAKSLGRTVTSVADLQRFEPNRDFPAANAAAFDIARGESAQVAGRSADTRVLFSVVDVSQEAFDAQSDEAVETRDAVRAALQNDVAEQYLRALRENIDVSVNQTAVDYVTGAQEIQPY